MFEQRSSISRKNRHIIVARLGLDFLLAAACMVWAGATWAGARNPVDGPSPNLAPPHAAKGSRPEVTVGSEVFLKGNFVEVGVSEGCYFGTYNDAPEGFHPIGRSNLGFVADFQRDGWDVGTPPQTGDYFLPGSPFEGWSIKWGTVSPSFGNFGGMGSSIMPASVMESSEAGMQSAVWVGEIAGYSPDEKLRMIQTVSVGAGDLFFVVNVQLTNTGTVTLPALRYLRCVDPDMEVDLGGDFTTSNFVAFQPGHPGNPDKALVVAHGLMYGITLGLGTFDSRAMAAVSPWWAMDPDDVYNNLFEPEESNPDINDSAISLAFSLGDLAPGQSVSFNFAYILNESDLDVALGNLGAVSILQPSGSVSGNHVPFQVTTSDVAHTAKVDFYVNGTLVGTDTTPDAGGVFGVTFNALDYPNGTYYKFIRAIATFQDTHTVSKSTTLTIANSGPPVEFEAPLPGQFPLGSGLPARIGVLDTEHPPARVSFFRETSGTGTLALGEILASPFQVTFSTMDLPPNETVVLKAVARDAAGNETVVYTSGTTANAPPPTEVSPSGSDMSASKGSGSSLILHTSGGCHVADTSVYVGDLTTLAAHGGVEWSHSICNLGTGASITFAPGPGQALYFVVVPNNGYGVEGSYGQGTAGERTRAAASSCAYRQELTGSCN